MKSSLSGSEILVKFKPDESNAGDLAPKFKVLYTMDSHFRSVVSHNNYWLLERTQACNGKKDAWPGKYVKRMEFLMKIDNFDDKDWIWY